MNIKTKAKLLLKYGSLKKYLNSYIEKNKLEEQFVATDDAIDDILVTKVDEQNIESEWKDEDKARDFIEAEFDKSDILYADWDDAKIELFEEIIYDIANSLCKQHFKSDSEMTETIFELLQDNYVPNK